MDTIQRDSYLYIIFKSKKCVYIYLTQEVDEEKNVEAGGRNNKDNVGIDELDGASGANIGDDQDANDARNNNTDNDNSDTDNKNNASTSELGKMGKTGTGNG